MANNNNEKAEEFAEEDKPEECYACGGPLVLEKVNLEDYQGGKLYMMEKVPAFVCQNCGEVWVPESIMSEFERMIETVKQKKKAAQGKTGTTTPVAAGKNKKSTPKRRGK
jgi:YgiT-type zinc finger domain-containing protein